MPSDDFKEAAETDNYAFSGISFHVIKSGDNLSTGMTLSWTVTPEKRAVVAEVLKDTNYSSNTKDNAICFYSFPVDDQKREEICNRLKSTNAIDPVKLREAESKRQYDVSFQTPKPVSYPLAI